MLCEKWDMSCGKWDKGTGRQVSRDRHSSHTK